MLAKSHKLPFAASDNVSTAPFDLVHTDLWGPAPVESVNEYRYYVSYIDDHTKYTWIYLLKLKSEVSTTFIHFHNMVETQFQARIKSVQSDGGTEYKPLNEFFKAKGILHRVSCPYTPQQNGCAERKHRHVVEMGLSLLAESNMPLKYWDDAFTTATYLINRVPAKGIEFVSPYEKLTKQRPDYTSLKVFGCLCYPYTRPYNKHKLEYRSQPGVFIGYSLQYKGYKVLLPSGKVIITRHVIFEESVFPFSKVENQDQQKQVLPPVFASSEPTVATFPKFLSQNNHNVTPENEKLLQTPYSSQHSQNTFDTVPLQDVQSQVDTSTNYTLDSPQSVTQRREEMNQHPMITRAKAGIHKPKVLTAKVTEDNEPENAEEALKNMVWRRAMKEEYDALLRNKTWTLTPLPAGAHVVGNKWVFKVKRGADGRIERHKARLVAQGYTQMAGFDFHETFSPVVKPTTIRIILTLALSYSWNIRQLDVSNAFLNGDLSEEIYMRQPKGFEQGKGLVCRLHKALYGLKQASRAWYIKVKKTLESLGFNSSKSDNSLFIYNRNGVKIFILIYVDDILITGSNEEMVQKLIKGLEKKFSLKDLGKIHHFLGIEVRKTSHGMHLNQREYIKNLLKKANMQHANKCPTPMITSPPLSRYVGDPVKDAPMYRSIVGALHYVTITRPEISFAVNKVSQYMANPLEPHLKAVKRILRYLGGTLDYGLDFQKPKTLNVTGFSDSDWGADSDDGRSTSGYCVYLGENLISWSSKKQQCVSKSSTEAEYRSLGQIISEIIWLQHLLEELEVKQTKVPQVWIDNQSAIYLSSNPILHARTKHIELDYHFIREKVAAGMVHVNYVPSADQRADILTKPLSLQFFTRMRNNLTVKEYPEFELRGSESQVKNYS